MTGESRLSKRAEGVHYDPPLRMHIRIDGGDLRGLKGSYCQFRYRKKLIYAVMSRPALCYCQRGGELGGSLAVVAGGNPSDPVPCSAGNGEP